MDNGSGSRNVLKRIFFRTLIKVVGYESILMILIFTRNGNEFSEETNEMLVLRYEDHARI